MSLTSGSFAIFLAVTLGLYWTAGRRRTPRLIVLTLAGYAFYAGFNIYPALAESGGAFFTDIRFYFFFLLLFVSLVDFGIARRIARARGAGAKRSWLALSVVIDLSLLASFKYLDFLIENLVLVCGWAGVDTDLRPLWLPLPVGISFYIFQTLSHTIEVYRGRAQPAGTLLDHLCYLAFFPRLVAGPIVRSGEFLPQLAPRPAMDRSTLGLALFLLISGFTKKLVFADALALNLVDRVFDLPRMYSTPEVLLAIYGFTVQIYCDFSGYTDLALGLALLFGLRLPENFDFPYQAADLREFWRRWHMTLSRWLRDFLYISLGGARVSGAWKIYRNLMITMLLGGLWHGAGWTFVIWGGLHGAGLAVTRMHQRRRGRRGRAPSASPLLRALKVLFTFHFVVLAWVFFRADSLGAVADLWRAAAFWSFTLQNVEWSTLVLLGAAAGLMWFPRGAYLRVREFYRGLPIWGQLLLAALAGYGIYRLTGGEMTEFVYEQF